MQEAVAGIEAGCKRVFTFAPSAGASRGVLRREGFSSADTVARLLQDPKQQRAIDHAKVARGTLVVAKLDRLARNVAFLSAIMESDADFVCCDNPHANKLTVHILAAVAEIEQRTGKVFELGINDENRVGRIVSAIGKRAGAIVNSDQGKFASAEDYRRSYGTRWADKVKPARLQQLMRHESIQTTMKYNVAIDADDVAEQLWRDHANRAPGYVTSALT